MAEQIDRRIQESWSEIIQHVNDDYLSNAQRWPWIVGSSGGPPTRSFYPASRRDVTIGFRVGMSFER